MIDAISLVAGAAVLAIGLLAGVAVGRRTRAICACGHPAGTHLDKKYDCQADVRREHYSKFGQRNGWEYVGCACLRYVGPVPITSDGFYRRR